ncbi:MAG: chorismate-binding protein [Flavihumibacter sp.]
MPQPPVPFSVYYKLADSYCLCASPERYFRLEHGRIWSEPVKGTAARRPDPAADREVSRRLRNDPKEQAENVMVVDLVRNDLSRVCQSGTVRVEQLFGVYPFPRVHQMISTITGELKEGLGWTDVVAASFPMGSMTGAPKKRGVLELIGDYERRGRGIFSGSIGYIDPGGQADFNVVIRSVWT